MHVDVRMLQSLILHKQSVKGRVTLTCKYRSTHAKQQLDKARDYILKTQNLRFSEFEILNLTVS